MSEFNEGKPVSLNLPGASIEVGGIIESEAAQQCDDCGDIKELRPYGPGGSSVCFDCAMKDREGTERRFHKLLTGEEKP